MGLSLIQLILCVLMNPLLLILFVLSFVGQFYAQEEKLDANGSTDQDPKLKIESFSYPTFLNGEVHSSFLMDYKLSEKLSLRLQGFYDTYILADVFKAPMTLNWYVSEKLFLFTGTEFYFEQDKLGLKPPVLNLYMTSGMGYDVNNYFTIEAKQDVYFNTSNLGNYATPNLFSLGGKYKF